jgi:hypothetical protein
MRAKAKQSNVTWFDCRCQRVSERGTGLAVNGVLFPSSKIEVCIFEQQGTGVYY